MKIMRHIKKTSGLWYWDWQAPKGLRPRKRYYYYYYYYPCYHLYAWYLQLYTWNKL